MFAANHFNQPFNNNNNNYNMLNIPNMNINPALPVNMNMGIDINQQQQQQMLNINLQHQMNMQNMHIQPLQNYYHQNMPMLNPSAPLSVPVPVNNLNINPINLALNNSNNNSNNNNNNYMINNQSYYNPIQQQQPQQQQAPLAPAQPNGGVSEVLDYDIDQMLKFISWLTFGLLKKCSTPTTTFQNNLHSVLSATRLPKSTLLLAVNYLSIKMDSQIEPYNVETEDEIFKIIVILLILSNKFNDDKTFRNKSWSDATNLSLSEINQMERNWLKDCDYRLFTTSDYETVENCWNTWCIKNIQSFDSFELSQPQILTDDFQYITPISSVPSSPVMGSCQFAPYNNNATVQNQIFENPFQQQQNQFQQHQFHPISPITDNYYFNEYNNTYTNPNTSFYSGYDYPYLPSHYPATTSSTNAATANSMYNFCTASAC